MDLVTPEMTLGRYVNGCTRDGAEQTRAIYGDAKLAGCASSSAVGTPTTSSA